MTKTKEFQEWLSKKKGLSEKSARDVVYRVKRAGKLISISPNKTEDELLFRMGQSPKFKSLTVSVRSQLRRAVRLYKMFEKG